MKTEKKEKSTRIYANKLLAEIINSRDVMDVLEAAVQKTNTELVVLDFTNIKFISRSAAHALLLLKEKFEYKSSNKKIVSFENAIYDVSEMLRIVNANKAYPKEERVEFNPKRIDIASLFKQAA
ncbi:MAG: hypothetical protein ABII07_02910 [Patescibacteria group bacterium]